MRGERAPYDRGMHLVWIKLRSVGKFLLQFDGEAEASVAHDKLAEELTIVGSGWLTIADDTGRTYAFRKRDFRYVELWGSDGRDDDDDDDDDGKVESDGGPPETLRPRGDGVEVPDIRGPLSALEAAFRGAAPG